jgi:hypothetical protein
MDFFLNHTAILVSIQALWVVSAALLLSNVVNGDNTSTTLICAIPCYVIQEAIIEKLEKFDVLWSLSLFCLEEVQVGPYDYRTGGSQRPGITKKWKMISYDRGRAHKCMMSDSLGIVP